jgi:histidinol dehydrogenase
VAAVVADVRARGDAAVDEWSQRLDGIACAPARAGSGLAPTAAVTALAARVRRWHELQLPAPIELEVERGVTLTRSWLALDSVGIYVPRNLVSTLVMCAVPALAAGVGRIVVVTPPAGAKLVAEAARLLGLDEVWAVGGPHAVAALAYGTKRIPAVAKIVGPGNAYVNEAKLQVSSTVAIDLPAGPSEVVVLLSDERLADLAQLEVAAQAEHGHDAVCTIIRSGADMETALTRVEEIAPEHLVLLGDEAEAQASRIRNAGAIFVGPDASVALGDYATGANHVLPTGRWARSVGGIGIETFLRPVTTQRVTAAGLEILAPTVADLAAAEGLPAHAAAVEQRIVRNASAEGD